MAETPRIVYWIKRLSEIALIGWLLALLLVDVIVAVHDGPALWPNPVCGATGVLAVLWRRSHRIGGFVTLLSVSFTSTLIIGMSGGNGAPGLAESVSLLVLTVSGLRRIEPVSRAGLFALASIIVLETAAGRLRETEGALAAGFLALVGWSFAAAIGAYLRFQLERRKEAVRAVRRAERLELARELHDLVAHHITGIVVQAQAAKVIAERRPEAVLPALEAIAGAGSDALTSMRRLVGVLRAEDSAARSPGARLIDLRTMVERFSAGGPYVALDIGPGITDETLPPEVMITLHRVLQECLTNVRKHAPAAGRVEARLWLGDGRDRRSGPGSAGSRTAHGQARPRPGSRSVWLRVRDYGSAADPRVARLGGGFGLVGMAERVEALGGRLDAGHTPEGAWEVLAEFPV